MKSGLYLTKSLQNRTLSKYTEQGVQRRVQMRRIASMKIQTLRALKTKLVAAGLLTVSTCGTMALFGAVPVIARFSGQAEQAQVQPPQSPEILKASRFID
jgi:hypothetical protein